MEREVDVDDSAIRPVPAGTSSGRNLLGQLVRSPDVVVVAERDPVTGGHADAGVASRLTPCGNWVAKVLGSGVGEAGDDVAGPVGRAVVHDDDLELDVTLCQHRTQRGPQECAAVVRRNDDGHLGHVGSVWRGSSDHSPSRCPRPD